MNAHTSCAHDNWDGERCQACGATTFQTDTPRDNLGRFCLPDVQEGPPMSADRGGVMHKWLQERIARCLDDHRMLLSLEHRGQLRDAICRSVEEWIRANPDEAREIAAGGGRPS